MPSGLLIHAVSTSWLAPMTSDTRPSSRTTIASATNTSRTYRGVWTRSRLRAGRCWRSGSDSEQIIRRGGRWTGIDLTGESVDRVRTRLELRKLPYEDITQASVLELPFPDNRFDVVFSHGVLHHVPGIAKAQSEVARVLRPAGELVVMLYSKFSLNYLVSIGIVRRLGLSAMYSLDRLGLRFGGIYGRHVENARQVGLRRYLAMRHFVHRNTDGPDNPYSKVYSLAEVRRDFPSFRVVRAHKEYMHAPPLPVERLGLASVAGWHLWVHMQPVSAPPMRAPWTSSIRR
jgi:SAM-dependent methyltransferase